MSAADALSGVDTEPAQRAMQKGPKKFFKLTFIIYGDRDEVEPVLGVASGLKKAGHDVLFITHHSYKGLVELWGLRFGPGNPYDPQLQYSTEYSSMIMMGQSGDLCLSKFIHLNNNFKLIEEATLTCIKRMTDVIVCNSLATVVGLAVARRLKLPFIGCYTTPETPTQSWPYMPHGGGKGTFGWSNAMSYSVALRAQWMALRKTVCEWHQKRVGVQRIDDGWRNLGVLHHQDFPVMHGFSPLVLGKPHDWGRWITLQGFWVPPAPAGWAPTEELLKFVQSGPAPVFVGFGAMGSADSEGLAAVAMEAARLTGVRVVLQSDWEGFAGAPLRMPRTQSKKRVCGVITGSGPKGGLVAEELPQNVALVDRNVPISWLFANCALAVHSAASLYTGAAVKAGVPSVCCPFVGEQRFWCEHLKELGVAHAAVPIEKLTPDSLASAITSALADKKLVARAQEVKQMLKAEDGTLNAVDFMSRFMQRPWDRTAMQILPRREGDLEMQEGSLFKSWSKYKFVLKDHCLEYHRYLPTGLHDPKVLGTLLIADTEVREFADASGQSHTFEIRDKGGKLMVQLSATSPREMHAWLQALGDVSKGWEVDAGAEVSWSTGMASKLRQAERGEDGSLIGSNNKNVYTEDGGN
uniref:PH domain-containing protein n=1 Tax=Hemiselmis tepida TaxID=464990 RepID=A0A6T6SEE8_9CRYP|mmetsp:Transcript_17068/g.43004  ORF Transcript_17068/g.43004 Transcript_17068/m.43004 type:complete len:637 (+) Transcript_17068:57-1967(+)|eukprot:CAMPEP_0174929570 /NCGR_PEP_ID=MMETSP1355-20121228/27675_1 /TAXON_ID=464990 /ORGANISM="Hemiselmis tepida, Strain CCMP443" /LENGTH=636 /DNA_ID=CAMNT_0016175783 /DNA_START=45 /DNA_END=1955 /DNA_ORIENTATION=-